MKKINKTLEPAELARWKKNYPKLNSYNDLNDKTAADVIKTQGAQVITAIRTQNVIDQSFLCAFCCCEIQDNPASAMNEHVEPRSRNHHRELDFTNIVASCTNKGQCDDAHGSQALPLTPLMAECESELKFRFSGTVEGLTPRAKETIQMLNLGESRKSNKGLVTRRRIALEMLLLGEGVEGDELPDLTAFIPDMIANLNTAKDGKLPPFSPVLSNILRGINRP
ncbi:MAG: TIGR02646 family protein [Algicola sp.]|nr:TIGR02646 family protein [Algicola sp.]